MNKATPAPESVSIYERLRSVPKGLILKIDTQNSLGVDTRSLPVGAICHEAAAELERLAAQAEPAPAPVGEYPPMDEEFFSDYGNLWTLIGNWHGAAGGRDAECAGEEIEAAIKRQMRTYLDADRAQRPAREVRLLTVDESYKVCAHHYHPTDEPGSWKHEEGLAEAIQCKLCEVNGLTIKEQS